MKKFLQALALTMGALLYIVMFMAFMTLPIFAIYYLVTH